MAEQLKAVGVMDFAGGFACGVSQAGFDYVAKREPSAFDGFGVPSVEANFTGVEIEVSEPELWSMRNADLLFGCPPCSGFSMLSAINTADSKTGVMDADGNRVSQRGIDSPVNQHMFNLMNYAARVKPQVVVMESVPSGGKLGAPLMKQLWELLREKSGIDYHMTDVFMNAASVGGDVIRPRYFFVAHQAPFGVDLPRARPRALMDVIGDLPLEAGVRTDPGEDLAWGHVTNGSRSDERIRATIEEFRSKGYDWAQGKRLPEHLKMWADELGHGYPDYWRGTNGELLSHAVSDNLYSPFRWRANTPMGVVTGGFMDRAIHPLAARTFTYREGARFMGLPDDWSLLPIVSGKRDSWLGKAIPVSSGRWIATWAKASIEEEPGEFAGVPVEPKHRRIDVTTEARVETAEIEGRDEPWWWDRPIEPKVIYSYAAPGAERVEPAFAVEALPKERRGRPPTASRPVGVTARRPRTVAATERIAPRREVRAISRIRPEVISAYIDGLGLSRRQAAEAMGVSQSRVAEMTGMNRPNSWLNDAKWEGIQAQLQEYADALV